MIDGEIRAMDRAWAAIRTLDPESRRRVIGYLQRRADSESAALNPGDAKPENTGLSRLGRDWRVEVGHLIAAGKLTKIGDRILVVAALLQWEHPAKDFSAKEIHQPLKDLGEPVVNISAHLNSIMARGPKKWIIQAERLESGHKRYLVTERGLREARNLISDAAPGELKASAAAGDE